MVDKMKPFLKWAGGKYKLVPQLKKHFPKGKRFVEPFWFGAVSLNVDYPSYRANDTNSTIVSLWQCIKDPKFIDYGNFFTKNNKEATYYRFRKSIMKLKIDPWAWKLPPCIYLNKHGYNGLCRYNSKGEFNVPFGHKTMHWILRKELTAATKLYRRWKLASGFPYCICRSQAGGRNLLRPPVCSFN